MWIDMFIEINKSLPGGLKVGTKIATKELFHTPGDINDCGQRKI